MQLNAVISTALVVVSVIFPIISLVAVLLRLKARRKSRLGFMSDDWWIIAAWIVCLGLSLNLWIFASITGIDKYKINYLKGIERSMQCLLICSVILQPCLTAVKISILLFYKRIFSVKSFAIATWVAIAVVGGWGILFFFLVLLEGDPISKSWTGIGHYRFDEVAVGLAQSGTSIALDVIVLLFPIPMLFSLQMPTRQKVGVMMIFWLGAFCCVAAIVRLVLLHASLSEVAEDRYMIQLQGRMMIFMFIEPNCSIIAACLPTYGILFAGGRTLKSMVASWRSAFSLRSRTNSFRSTPSGDADTMRRAGGSMTNNKYSNDESQTELTRFHNAPWAVQEATAQFSDSQHQSDEEPSERLSSGITVKTKLDVSIV